MNTLDNKKITQQSVRSFIEGYITPYLIDEHTIQIEAYYALIKVLVNNKILNKKAAIIVTNKVLSDLAIDVK